MILLLLGTLHLVGGALMADSLADFSGTQGAGGWHYHYFDGNAEYPLEIFGDSWIGGTSSWQYPGSWCQIGSTIMHTTTAVGCDTPFSYCAPVLRWVNPDQTHNLSVSLSTSQTTTLSADRDGVNLTVKINNNPVDQFSTPFNISKIYSSQNISSFELYLDPKQDCNNDNTEFRIKVYGPDPTSTATASYTSSPTPSGSIAPICSDVFKYLYGTQETVNGDGVAFTVNHGSNVTHFPPYEVCGTTPTCVSTGILCRCTYTNGAKAGGCPTPRTTTITYSYGSNSLTYSGQSPTCAYHISRVFAIPSPSPSPTISPTITPSSTLTPTSSATGICNDIKNYVNGRMETVMRNDTPYNIFHGRYITTPYLENFDMLLGVFNGCADKGQSCICYYDRGYDVDCPSGVQRNAVVNFTYGAAFQTAFYNQSDCSFSFNASYIRPSATPSRTVTTSQTASLTPTASETATQTATQTATWTMTPSWTSTASKTASSSARETASQTSSVSSTKTGSATATITQTASVTISPTVTPTGICNDVRNYVFGRRDTPTAEYTIRHGDHMTHYYYPGQYVLIGHAPTCTDQGDTCVCVYGGGDSSFCHGGRRGIVRYSYDSVYRTFLVNDTDPVCIYQFNTTFFLPYLSPATTRTGTPSPLPTRVPPYVAAGVSFLPPPPGLPPILTNASNMHLGGIAEEYIATLNISNGNSTDMLAALASTLAAVNGNLSLSVAGEGFTWVMTPATFATPITVGNVSAVLPPLGSGMVYSFVSTQSNSSFPTFSVDVLGTLGDKFIITNLASPLQFIVSASPAVGQKIECIYWNGTSWDTTGCAFANGTCACSHFTEFSARFASILETNTAIFGAVGDVYSITGFKKYAVIYGTLIGLFATIICIYFYLVRLDKRGEQQYRLAVEEIDEVCKVLGFERPHTPQPLLALPPPSPTRRPIFFRFCSAWGSRLFYHHSYFGIFFRYDPRLPRGLRLLSLASVAFHTLFLTVFLYGYSKASAEMTIGESAVLSLITATLNIPFLRILLFFLNNVSEVEYKARFPDFSHEYNRRRAFESALRLVKTEELQRIIDRMNMGKSAKRAAMASPGVVRHKRASVCSTTMGLGAVGEDAAAMGEDNADTVLVSLFDRLVKRCCPCRTSSEHGFGAALQLAAENDPHFQIPACNVLPTKTLRGFLFSAGLFIYIGWIMNYLLLFTASHSTNAMNAIASSFGISQGTSILITQPMTLFLTLFGTWAVMQWRRSRGTGHVNHIGYFADPFFKNGSTSLSGAWAYWIFLYGGSAGSIGIQGVRRSVGYSSTAVALAWLNGSTNVGTTPRDAAITALYIYLRGIQKPVFGRAAAAAAAAAEIRGLIAEAPHSSIRHEADPTDEESGEMAEIVKIATITKDAGSRIIS